MVRSIVHNSLACPARKVRQVVEAGLWMGLYHSGLVGARKALERAVRTLEVSDSLLVGDLQLALHRELQSVEEPE